MTDGGRSIEVTRRTALGAGAVAAGYALAARPVLAQVIRTDAEGLVAGDHTIEVGAHRMPVYEARPAGGTSLPIVVLVSEIFGLHAWIRDVARRLAKAGYLAVAPELFAREGGVAHLASIPEILKVVLGQPLGQTLGDLAAASAWAAGRPGARGDRVAAVGWCWGGGVVLQQAAAQAGLTSAVAWYGPPGRAFQTAAGPVTGFDVAPRIRIPVLGLFGELDRNPSPIDARRLGEILGRGHPRSEIVVFPGAGHGFFADYRPAFHAPSAAEAWRRSLAFLAETLRA